MQPSATCVDPGRQPPKPVPVFKPDELVYRALQRLPIRMLSLRAIVIFAALAVVVLVLTLGTWVWVVSPMTSTASWTVDWTSVSSLGDLEHAAVRTIGAGHGQPGRQPGAHRSGGAWSGRCLLAWCCPNWQTDTPTRPSMAWRTGSAPSRSPAHRSRWERRWPRPSAGFGSCTGGWCSSAAASSSALSWWAGHPLIMIDPFRLLAQQARAINAQSKPEEVQVRGVSEAVEIGEAVEGMLARIGDEQARTKAALESARDFAAVASHELVHPLTAMRTNLEVLSTLALGDEQRKEVIGDTIRTQARIEATLTALERLAQGELTTADDFVPFDITELLDRAAHDAERTYPDLRVSLVPSPAVLMVGLPVGLRLVIDNAIANAVRHGAATEVRMAVSSSADGVEVTIDDDGTGVPEDERATVFERFARGSTASRSGSGLGLALVAQQAELHGGAASLGTSPPGGARLSLKLAGRYE